MLHSDVSIRQRAVVKRPLNEEGTSEGTFQWLLGKKRKSLEETSSSYSKSVVVTLFVRMQNREGPRKHSQQKRDDSCGHLGFRIP